MQADISVVSFDWTYTNSVVEFLNKVDKVKNTEKEISEIIFTQYHKLPESNPKKDCFLAITQDHDIVGFMHIILEKKISRAVATTKILDSCLKTQILNQFMDIAISFASSTGVDVLHTQIEKKDSLSVEYFKKTWLPVKEYWNLKCTTEKFITPNTNHLPKEYSIENLDDAADISTLTDIQNVSFGNHWGFCPNTEEEIRARIKITNPNSEGILFIKNSEEIVGYNWTIFANKDGRATGWISMTGVAPAYRGLGLGKLVVTLGMDYLFNKGANSIELEVDSSNEPALSLYKSLGFEKQSETIWFQKTDL